MIRTLKSLVVVLGVLVSRPALGQIPFDDPNWPPFGLGDLTSDGSGGRQLVVRPLTLADVGREWAFFPVVVVDGPPESTPAQSAFFLTENTPLLLAIPQLAHFPQLADVHVEHMTSGQAIAVHTSTHFYPSTTTTAYGPHEYLYPLGQLPAGSYRLTIDFERTFDDRPEASFTLGFADFVVHPVPEPATGLLAGIATIVLAWRAVGRRLV